MARINIEDELHTDYRFKKLSRIVGNEDQAIGMLYRFWVQAQKLWGNSMGLMSPHQFESEDFHPILEAGLAEKQEGGIYAKGANKHFAWYLQKCEAIKIRWAQPQIRIRNKDSVIRNKDSVIPLAPALATTLDNKNTSNKESEDVPPLPPSAASLPCLQTLWNENSGELPKCERVTKKRLTAWAQRWKETPALDYWIDAVRRLSESYFCNGNGEDHGWRATVDFLLRPDTATKVFEDVYGKRKAAAIYQLKDYE